MPPWIINIYKYKLQIGNDKVKKNKLNDWQVMNLKIYRRMDKPFTLTPPVPLLGGVWGAFFVENSNQLSG